MGGAVSGGGGPEVSLATGKMTRKKRTGTRAPFRCGIPETAAKSCGNSLLHYVVEKIQIVKLTGYYWIIFIPFFSESIHSQAPSGKSWKSRPRRKRSIP
jgi:hypothetical protein